MIQASKFLFRKSSRITPDIQPSILSLILLKNLPEIHLEIDFRDVLRIHSPKVFQEMFFRKSGIDCPTNFFGDCSENSSGSSNIHSGSYSERYPAFCLVFFKYLLMDLKKKILLNVFFFLNKLLFSKIFLESFPYIFSTTLHE